MMAGSGAVASLVRLLLCLAALRPATVMVSGQDADSLASSFFSGRSYTMYCNDESI